MPPTHKLGYFDRLWRSPFGRRLKGMESAQTALANVFMRNLQEEPPLTWADKFKDAAKMAYNLQYMFRENIVEATSKFREALGGCPDGTSEMFGSEQNMFEMLLNKALDIYGNGLVDQENLAKTDFTNEPERLVEVVRETAQGKGRKMELISEMTQSASAAFRAHIFT